MPRLKFPRIFNFDVFVYNPCAAAAKLPEICTLACIFRVFLMVSCGSSIGHLDPLLDTS